MPANSLLIIGGYDYSEISDKVYELTCEKKIGCQWSTKDWQLKKGRRMHVSFLLPEKHLSCSVRETTTQKSDYCDSVEVLCDDGSGTYDTHEEGSGSDFEEGSGKDFEEGGGSDFEEGSSNEFAEGSGSDFVEGSGSEFEEGSGSAFEEGSGSDTAEGSGSDTAEGSGSISEEGSGSISEEGSGSISEEVIGNKFEEGSDLEGESGSEFEEGSGFQEGSGSSSEGGSGSSSVEGSGSKPEEGSGSDSEEGSSSVESNETGDYTDEGNNGIDRERLVLLLEGRFSPGASVLKQSGRECRLRPAIPPPPHFYGNPGRVGSSAGYNSATNQVVLCGGMESDGSPPFSSYKDCQVLDLEER